ncbi:MAG: hypothetical protein JO021_04145, partial [Alphaproteobacteria bacterium]|nr:hypothetical protein [Alphaproteobacteria bacterium]
MTETTNDRLGGTLRRSIGVRGKIFAAIAVIAAFVPLATVVATFSFAEISRLFRGVSEQDLPRAVATFELAAESQALAAALPPLYNAKTDADRTQQAAAVDQKLKTFAEHVRALNDAATSNQVATLVQRIATLDKMVAGVIAAAGEQAAVRARVAEAHRKFLDAVEPPAQQAQADLAMTAMGLSEDAKKLITSQLTLVGRQVPLMQTLSIVTSNANLLIGYYGAAATADDPALLEQIDGQITKAVGEIRFQLDVLDRLTKTDQIRPAAEAVLAFATGDTAITA